MEVTQENINELVNALTIKGLNKSFEKLGDIIERAEKTIRDNPDASMEELHEIFEREQEELMNNIELKNGKDSKNEEDTERD